MHDLETEKKFLSLSRFYFSYVFVSYHRTTQFELINSQLNFFSKHYNEHFLTLESQTEAVPISLNTDDSSLPYNLPISLPELLLSIYENLRNFAPGPDNIPASMLKNLRPNFDSYLLS